jgi:serine/threonine-protein kinase
MASVWRAWHVQFGTEVAIKLLDPCLAKTRDGMTRFWREAMAAGSLSCPHIVRVFECGMHDGIPFMAMELLHGESLAARLRRVHHLTTSDSAWILGQVARAVETAHAAGIIHRDLKPENIFLVREPQGELAKVLDFGFAKRVGASLLSSSDIETGTGTMLGTPYYASPEQMNGRRNIDHRTDVWSFGVIAGECLTGHRLFDGNQLGSLALAICHEPLPIPSRFGSVPTGFDRWFARCVARDVAERFSTIREAAADFLEICAAAGKSPRADARESAHPPASAAVPTEFSSTVNRHVDTFGLGEVRTPLPPPPKARPKSLQLGVALALVGFAAFSVTLLGSRIGHHLTRPPASLAVVTTHAAMPAVSVPTAINDASPNRAEASASPAPPTTSPTAPSNAAQGAVVNAPKARVPSPPANAPPRSGASRAVTVTRLAPPVAASASPASHTAPSTPQVLREPVRIGF